jgi:hypothetical protein
MHQPVVLLPEYGVVPALVGGAEATAMVGLREGFGLPALEALLCGAEALQLDHPTARTLRSVVARGQEWEVSARLHVSSRATHTPDALLSLLERADTLPASLPTRPALEAVLDAARRWQVAADRLLEGARPPPERLWNPSAAAGEAASALPCWAVAAGSPAQAANTAKLAEMRILERIGNLSKG